MKVIIPVAGEGTRLRPHTYTTPKSLLHVAGKPILGHILDQIKDIDISEVVFVIGQHGDQIKKYVSDNYSFKATFVHQEKGYGLGYAVHLGVVDDSEDLLIILGDTIVELDWQALINTNRNTLLIKEVDDPRSFGVAVTDGDKIIQLIEKPKNPPSNKAVVGVYYIKNSVEFKESLDEIVNNGVTTHGEIQLTDAFDLLSKKGIDLYSYSTDNWYDCGRKETILATNCFLLERIGKPTIREGSIIIEPSFVAPSAILENSIVGPNVSISEDAIVRNSIISDSVIWIGAQVESSILNDSLIGKNTTIKDQTGSFNIDDSSNTDTN